MRPIARSVSGTRSLCLPTTPVAFCGFRPYGYAVRRVRAQVVEWTELLMSPTPGAQPESDLTKLVEGVMRRTKSHVDAQIAFVRGCWDGAEA